MGDLYINFIRHTEQRPLCMLGGGKAIGFLNFFFFLDGCDWAKYKHAQREQRACSGGEGSVCRGFELHLMGAAWRPHLWDQATKPPKQLEELKPWWVTQERVAPANRMAWSGPPITSSYTDIRAEERYSYPTLTLSWGFSAHENICQNQRESVSNLSRTFSKTFREFSEHRELSW